MLVNLRYLFACLDLDALSMSSGGYRGKGLANEADISRA